MPLSSVQSLELDDAALLDELDAPSLDPLLLLDDAASPDDEPPSLPPDFASLDADSLLESLPPLARLEP